MEKIEQWCTALCVVCITTGVMIHIIPDGKIKKCVNIAYSLLFLTTVISLFDGIESFNIDINYENENILTYSSDLKSYVTDIANKQVKTEIDKVLKKICTDEYIINLEWTDNNNTYQLSAVTIIISDKEMINSMKIKSEISALTGVVPEVKTSNEH